MLLLAYLPPGTAAEMLCIIRAMILSDRDLRDALLTGRIVIEPLEDLDVQIQPCSIDLRLGNQFVVYRHSHKPFIDPLDHDLADYTEQITVEDGDAFYLHPGEFVLGTTKERVEVPADLVARVDGRSSIGRLAILIHATAGFVDAGFCGQVTLELSNVGKMPVALRPNMRVCQISFEQMSSAAERPYGLARGSKYQGQTGPTPSRIHSDPRRAAAARGETPGDASI